MEVRDRDRSRFIRSHARDLQGLRVLVPAGMLAVFQGLAPQFDRWPLALALLVAAGLVGGALALSFGSGRYYRGLVGEVQSGDVPVAADWLPVLAMAGGVLVYLLARGSLSLPRVESLLLGAVLLNLWFLRDRRWSQSYHLLLGILLLAIAVRAPGASAAAQREIAYGLGGACWIVAGLLDHLQLARAIGRPTVLRRDRISGS